MKSFKIIIILVLFFGMQFSLQGCKQKPPTGQISGTVSYKGTPLKKGVITFDVDGARQGRAEVENGAIVNASTYDTNDGISVGEARVSIVSYDIDSPVEKIKAPVGGPGGKFTPPPFPKVKSNIPKKYANPHTSGLTASIKKGSNTLTFDLKD